MLEQYKKQVHLVARVLPHVAAEVCFAMKGGTAINLFEVDMPRLSVDIDLTFVKILDREKTILEINQALERIAKHLKQHGIEAELRGSENTRKINCFQDGVSIKVEPNFILRGTVFPVRLITICHSMVMMTRAEVQMQVLSFEKLYGGKVCAALDRQHPRDLFDMAQFYRTHSLAEIKKGVLALALGHNRPLHELLGPIRQDQRLILEQQFTGMSDEPFSYDDHQATLERLIFDIQALFDDSDKQKLLDFVSLSGERDPWGIPNFGDLPAIRWKRRNLESLRKTNPASLRPNVSRWNGCSR